MPRHLGGIPPPPTLSPGGVGGSLFSPQAAEGWGCPTADLLGHSPTHSPRRFLPPQWPPAHAHPRTVPGPVRAPSPRQPGTPVQPRAPPPSPTQRGTGRGTSSSDLGSFGPSSQRYLQRTPIPRGVPMALSVGQGSRHLPLHSCTHRTSHSTRGDTSPSVPILSLLPCWHSPAAPRSLRLLGAHGDEGNEGVIYLCRCRPPAGGASRSSSTFLDIIRSRLPSDTAQPSNELLQRRSSPYMRDIRVPLRVSLVAAAGDRHGTSGVWGGEGSAPPLAPCCGDWGHGASSAAGSSQSPRGECPAAPEPWEAQSRDCIGACVGVGREQPLLQTPLCWGQQLGKGLGQGESSVPGGLARPPLPGDPRGGSLTGAGAGVVSLPWQQTCSPGAQTCPWLSLPPKGRYSPRADRELEPAGAQTTAHVAPQRSPCSPRSTRAGCLWFPRAPCPDTSLRCPRATPHPDPSSRGCSFGLAAPVPRGAPLTPLCAAPHGHGVPSATRPHTPLVLPRRAHGLC